MDLFNTEGFPARWFCGIGWEESPWLGWLHIVSDLLTFLAYYAVPSVALYFVWRRGKFKFPTIFYVFLAAVFLTCGTGHLLEAVMFWTPLYRLAGWVKLVTALVSCAGVIVLARVLPRAWELKSRRAFDQVVDEREQARASLEHERFLLRTLLEYLPEAIYFKDAEGRFTRVSKQLAARLALASPEAAVGHTDADFFDTQYAASARRDELEVMRSGRALEGKEEQGIWPNGEEFWVSTSKLPMRDEDGGIIGTFGVSHDITAIKRAEQLFRQVVEATPNPIVVVDGQGRMRLVNAAVEQVFGYCREELLGQPVEMLVPERLRIAHVRHRQEYFQSVQRQRMSAGRELIGRRRDGSEFAVEIGLNIVLVDNQQLVLANVMDVTVRQKAEREMIRAREAAEGANRAKSEFLANMSHEIRTPMNAIIGMTELVLDTSLSATQRDYLSTVLGSAEWLLAIINEILDFSKIEAGMLKLEHLEFDLRELIGEAMKSLGERAAVKDLELMWSVAADVPPIVVGDQVRLRQILVNLVGNGIKFTTQGEVVVEVAALETSAEQVKLQVKVRDTGIGIAPEKQLRIFAPFEQGDTSTTRLFGGTGLGLAISGRLVRAMGGDIGVESAPNQGSTFHFTVMLGIGTGQGLARVDVALLRDVPVLVVDDNVTNRRILADTLLGWGMRVQVAESAVQAIDTLQAGQAAGAATPLILTDVHMPHVDGFMFVEQLRRMPAFQDAVVIVLTSGVHSGDATRGEQLRVAGRLFKPVKQSELRRALVQALTRKQDTAPPTSPAEGASAPPDDGRPLKILLAEDSIVNQKLAMAMLEKLGHHVVIAVNGQEAIDKWESGNFDAVLMDVQMPVRDGLEATRQIRRREQSRERHTPIIAMTARAMAGDRELCLAAGMDAYLAKPIHLHELRESLSGFFPDLPPVPPAPPPDATLLDLIDWQTIIRTVGGDAYTVRTLVEACVEEVTQIQDDLPLRLASENFTEARRLAHILQSLGRTFSVTALRDMALEVENAAARNDRDAAQAGLRPLRDILRQFLAELHRWLEQHQQEHP